jgi:hypothetical protein
LQVYRLDWLRWSRSTGIRLVDERVAEGERPDLYARVVNQLEGRPRPSGTIEMPVLVSFVDARAPGAGERAPAPVRRSGAATP